MPSRTSSKPSISVRRAALRLAVLIVGWIAMVSAVLVLRPAASGAAPAGDSQQNGVQNTVMTNQAPPPPPWVRADGSVDRSKLPAQLPVMDANGNPMLDSQGRQVTVSTAPVTGGPKTGTVPGTVTSYVDPATGETRTAETVDLTGK